MDCGFKTSPILLKGDSRQVARMQRNAVTLKLNCALNPLKGAKHKQLFVLKSPLGDLGASLNL